MRGLKKTAHNGANRQTVRQTDMATTRPTEHNGANSQTDIQTDMATTRPTRPGQRAELVKIGGRSLLTNFGFIGSSLKYLVLRRWQF